MSNSKNNIGTGDEGEEGEETNIKKYMDGVMKRIFGGAVKITANTYAKPIHMSDSTKGKLDRAIASFGERYEK